MFFKWLTILINAALLNAAVPCPPRNSILAHGRNLIEKVAIYDEIKPMTAKSFAEQQGLTEAQLAARYAATGVFYCDLAVGNGQVVVKGNTIVTVFHTLLKDRRTCDKPRNIKNCAFVYSDGGKPVTIKAKKVIAHGVCNPDGLKETGGDWAIVELEKSLPKAIVPYKIPDGPGLQAGRSVRMVGRTSMVNPNPKNKDFFENPQTFSNCVSVGKDTFSYWNDYQSNCPTAPGSSGSAILIGDGTPTLAGLLSGEIVTQEVCTPQVLPTSDDGPFEKNCRGSILTPVAGRFLDALKSIK